METRKGAIRRRAAERELKEGNERQSRLEEENQTLGRRRELMIRAATKVPEAIDNDNKTEQIVLRLVDDLTRRVSRAPFPRQVKDLFQNTLKNLSSLLHVAPSTISSAKSLLRQVLELPEVRDNRVLRKAATVYYVDIIFKFRWVMSVMSKLIKETDINEFLYDYCYVKLVCMRAKFLGSLGPTNNRHALQLLEHLCSPVVSQRQMLQLDKNRCNETWQKMLDGVQDELKREIGVGGDPSSFEKITLEDLRLNVSFIGNPALLARTFEDGYIPFDPVTDVFAKTGNVDASKEMNGLHQSILRASWGEDAAAHAVVVDTIQNSKGHLKIEPRDQVVAALVQVENYKEASAKSHKSGERNSGSGSGSGSDRDRDKYHPKIKEAFAGASESPDKEAFSVGLVSTRPPAPLHGNEMVMVGFKAEQARLLSDFNTYVTSAQGYGDLSDEQNMGEFIKRRVQALVKQGREFQRIRTATVVSPEDFRPAAAVNDSKKLTINTEKADKDVFAHYLNLFGGLYGTYTATSNILSFGKLGYNVASSFPTFIYSLVTSKILAFCKYLFWTNPHYLFLVLGLSALYFGGGRIGLIWKQYMTKESGSNDPATASLEKRESYIIAQTLKSLNYGNRRSLQWAKSLGESLMEDNEEGFAFYEFLNKVYKANRQLDQKTVSGIFRYLKDYPHLILSKSICQKIAAVLESPDIVSEDSFQQALSSNSWYTDKDMDSVFQMLSGPLSAINSPVGKLLGNIQYEFGPPAETLHNKGIFFNKVLHAFPKLSPVDVIMELDKRGILFYNLLQTHLAARYDGGLALYTELLEKKREGVTCLISIMKFLAVSPPPPKVVSLRNWVLVRPGLLYRFMKEVVVDDDLFGAFRDELQVLSRNADFLYGFSSFLLGSVARVSGKGKDELSRDDSRVLVNFFEQEFFLDSLIKSKTHLLLRWKTILLPQILQLDKVNGRSVFTTLYFQRSLVQPSAAKGVVPTGATRKSPPKKGSPHKLSRSHRSKNAPEVRKTRESKGRPSRGSDVGAAREKRAAASSNTNKRRRRRFEIKYLQNKQTRKTG